MKHNSRPSGRLPPLRETTPAVNFSVTGDPFWIEGMRAAYEKAAGQNLIRYTTALLGPPTRHFRAEFFWGLWEYPEFTIWVSNKGFSIEVLPPPKMTPDRAEQLHQLAFRILAGNPVQVPESQV